MAAVTAVKLADDPVAVEHHPRLQERRQRQVRRLLEHLAGLAVRQFVDPGDLDGEVVDAPPIVGLPNDRLRGAVQILGVVGNRGSDGTGIDMLANAVGRLHQHVALLELDRPIVDLDLGVHAQRPAEIGLLRRQDDSMILGELLEGTADQAIDARIADMEDMRGGRLQDHHAEGADIALVPVVGVPAAAGLGVEPGVGGIDDAPRRGLHGPRLRGAVVVRQEALHGRFGGNPAHVAAADPVGQGEGDALQAEQRLVRESGRRENPDWTPCGPCRSAARPRSSVHAPSDQPEQGAPPRSG